MYLFVTPTNYPTSVVSVGEKAFWNCASLQDVTFAAETQALVLGRGAFEGCGSLTGLELPACVSAVPERLCYGCSSLGSITLPERCTVIGKEAFVNCSALLSIQIPGSCISIGNSAFKRCSLLSSVIFEEPMDAGRSFLLGADVFYHCELLDAVSLPEGCTNIPSGAFWGCKGLKNISIPEGCTSIGDNAFYNCSALSQINSNNISDAILPKSCISVGKEAFRKCAGLKNVQLPSTCASIGDNAFNECTGLYTVTFLNPDTSIGTDAFPAAGKAPNLVIACARTGSVAAFAEGKGLPYKTEVQSITLTKLPVVTEYMYSEDERLDLTGMEVEAQVISEASDTGFAVEKVEPSNCTISGFNSTKLGKQTITVAYAGSQTSFEIKVVPKTISESNTVVSVEDVEYTGSQQKPVPKVVCGAKTLLRDTDYTVTYGSNIDIGKGFVVIEGTGNYDGSIKTYFNINAGSASGGAEGGGSESGGDKGGQAASGGTTASGNTQKDDSGSAKEDNTPADKPEQGKTYIYNNMYYKITSSETVTFMKPVKKNLKKIKIPTTVSILGQVFRVTKINKKACYRCTKATSVTIGDYVTTVGDEAFAKCSKLKTVTIGKGLIKLGKKTFYKDKRLRVIRINSSRLKSVGKGTLTGIKNVNIQAPKNKGKAYNRIFNKAK